ADLRVLRPEPGDQRGPARALQRSLGIRAVSIHPIQAGGAQERRHSAERRTERQRSFPAVARVLLTRRLKRRAPRHARSARDIAAAARTGTWAARTGMPGGPAPYRISHTCAPSRGGRPVALRSYWVAPHRRRVYKKAYPFLHRSPQR